MLDDWLADVNATEPWGTLIVRKNPADFPASIFSFSPNNRFGPARKLAHPQLHPTRFQRKPGDVMIHVPAKGPLPMGSFCGADGYGLIHPNLISAAVLQCCIASSQESTHHFKFDAMALAPNMDLLMSCKDAEKVAQTIVQWNCGCSRTDKMELIKPPGGNMSKDVGTPDWNVHVRSEVRTVFSYEPFRKWTSVTVEQTQEQRRIDRDGVANILKSTEHSLFGHMAKLTPQMGANLRAYHFLRNQEFLGMKPVKKITLLQVKEVIDQIVEWKWVSPATISSYSKYHPSAGGDMTAIVNDFKGRKRLKVLWDVTGYEVAKASWSRPRTKEEYFKTLAVFWSTNALVMLPSLPGIGSDPANIGGITFPIKMWEEDDRTGCSYTPMSQEELAEPLTPRRPSLVSDAPDLGSNLWHPLLADSEHAYAWWMLSQDELKTVVAVIEERTERKVTSRLTGPTPKPQVVVKKEKPTPKPKGTTSKSGSGEAVPPPKPKSAEALPASQTTPENILPREPKGPPGFNSWEKRTIKSQRNSCKIRSWNSEYDEQRSSYGFWNTISGPTEGKRSSSTFTESGNSTKIKIRRKKW